MRNIKLFFFLTTIFISVFVAGCKDNIVMESDLQPPSGMTAAFSKIQKQLFNTSCATSGCHTGNNPQAGLNLSEGLAFNNLINVQSVLYPNLKRVTPGNKEASLLYVVLSYNSETRMPPIGKMEQSVIDSVGAWIDKGAPNN
jgi:hypothetical protein